MNIYLKKFTLLLLSIVIVLMWFVRGMHFFDRRSLSDTRLLKSFAVYDKQATIDYVEIDKERRLRYLELWVKNWPLLILIHGAPGNIATWSDMIKKSNIINTYRIFIMDRPWYGKSWYGQAQTSLAEQSLLDMNTTWKKYSYKFTYTHLTFLLMTNRRKNDSGLSKPNSRMNNYCWCCLSRAWKNSKHLISNGTNYHQATYSKTTSRNQCWKTFSCRWTYTFTRSTKKHIASTDCHAWSQRPNSSYRKCIFSWNTCYTSRPRYAYLWRTRSLSSI